MTNTSVGTDVVSVRIRLRSPEQSPGLNDFGYLFPMIESLMFVGALVSEVDPKGKGQFSRGSLVSPNVLVSCQYLVESLRVGRVSFGSPIDILIWGAGITGSVPTMYGTVRTVLSLWTKFCEARKKHAEASLMESDVAVLMAINNNLLAKLESATPGSNLDRQTLNEVEKRALDKSIRQRVQEAAAVILSAEEITIEPDPA
ncbi:hypothetical protein A5699_18460 [Mycobacterium sp. E802]|uniref:hypothetical protein n=1 Tax=Mycobacterium sp. E802 TaxID=1834152 RepID=UPI0007FCE178|nr:hypothetical protein [Mycobacterium sp. E802]OBG87855.1 hypothetical protein A5699_18460 [Mycobacterium sp. E802]